MQGHHSLRQRCRQVQAARHHAAQIGRGMPAIGAEDRPGDIHRATGAKVVERDPRVAGFAARRRPPGPGRAALRLASRRRDRRVPAEVARQRLRAGRPDRLPPPRYGHGHVPNLGPGEEGAPRTEIPGELTLVVCAAHTQYVVEARRRPAVLVPGGHTAGGDQPAAPPDEIAQHRDRRCGQRRLFRQDHGGELVNALLQGRLVYDQRVPAALHQHLMRGPHACLATAAALVVGISQCGRAVQNSDERHHHGVTAPVLALDDELAGVGERLDNGRLVLPVGIRLRGEQAAPASGQCRRTGHIERRCRGQ